ncbi:MAG: hypothetical protein CM15mP120_24180 [Pseudomonadota bacterium]|nr:MAG: hypothetical protein CM15mP120_24180 [Pseudomonadota bacterium]
MKRKEKLGPGHVWAQIFPGYFAAGLTLYALSWALFFFILKEVERVMFQDHF